MQVANTPGSMFEVSALKGWDPIDYYPKEADTKAVDALLKHDLERVCTLCACQRALKSSADVCSHNEPSPLTLFQSLPMHKSVANKCGLAERAKPRCASSECRFLRRRCSSTR